MVNFNPRSPHGERRTCSTPRSGSAIISIHAPRTGSDTIVPECAIIYSYFNPRSPHGERPAALADASDINPFQSTLPARGATFSWGRASNCMGYFNPRSPHGERRQNWQRSIYNADFNPRSPHGERHKKLVTGFPVATFQSTLPARGATQFDIRR